jgi:hypothetical protein
LRNWTAIFALTFIVATLRTYTACQMSRINGCQCETGSVPTIRAGISISSLAVAPCNPFTAFMFCKRAHRIIGATRALFLRASCSLGFGDTFLFRHRNSQVRRLALTGQAPYLSKLKHLPPEVFHKRLPGLTLTATRQARILEARGGLVAVPSETCAVQRWRI